MPILATPPPSPALFEPPAAYIETPHGVRRMSADFSGWCVPVEDLPPEVAAPPGSDVLCGGVQAALTPYGACLRRMNLLPEVWARAGEEIRFHVPDGIGTPAVAITRSDVIEHHLDPITTWAAPRTPPGEPPALVKISASSRLGSVVYSARVVIGGDPSPPEVRLNLRRARGILEIRAPAGATVVACIAGGTRDRPLRLRDVRRVLRVAIGGPPRIWATVAVRGVSGVRTIARIGPR